MWTLPALPEIGLDALVMSDGPIGVRGVRLERRRPLRRAALPTALAATWDPELARRAGVLLAQEARRKGVHVLLAPTVNLHRSPLGGRHFEAYSEDPLLTGAIGAGYVRGVQSGGVGTTVKHFVANDAETDRFTVDNRVGERALRELYLAPFEAIVANARPWGVMTAYNAVNGTTMTEHRHLVNEVLRGEWGFDGVNVSDWMAARATRRSRSGRPRHRHARPRTVYGPPLAAAVRAGEVDESRRSTRPSATCCGSPPASAPGRGAEPAVDRAARPRGSTAGAGPRDRPPLLRPAIRERGAPCRFPRRHAGSPSSAPPPATPGSSAAAPRPSSPPAVVSPLDGLRAALPEDVA